MLQICGTELKSLDISSTSITGEDLSVLQGKVINLRTLDLHYCVLLTCQGLTELLQICGAGLNILNLFGNLCLAVT